MKKWPMKKFFFGISSGLKWTLYISNIWKIINIDIDIDIDSNILITTDAESVVALKKVADLYIIIFNLI